MRSSSTRSYAIAIGTIDRLLAIGLQRGLEQSGLGRLQLAAVAPSALGVVEQVALLEQLRDVGAQRHEIQRVLAVAADRNGAGHVLVEQSERAAEQVDAGGEERRPDAVVVEHERLDQIVQVALVVRDVDDAAVAATPSRACSTCSAMRSTLRRIG